MFTCTLSLSSNFLLSAYELITNLKALTFEGAAWKG